MNLMETSIPYLTPLRELKITFKKYYKYFEFVTLVNKNITALCVWHSVVW
jgi:hypothetical protein